MDRAFQRIRSLMLRGTFYSVPPTAKTNNSDWWYYYEIPMIRKTRTWMNSQTARQKNIP